MFAMFDAFACTFVPSTAITPTRTNPASRHNPSTSPNNPASAARDARGTPRSSSDPAPGFAAITLYATSSRHLRSIPRADRFPCEYAYINNAIIAGSYAARPCPSRR